MRCVHPELSSVAEWRIGPRPVQENSKFVLVLPRGDQVIVCFRGFRTVTMYFAEPCRRGVCPVDGPLVFKVGIL